MRATLSRRRLLAAMGCAAAGLITGCTGTGGTPAPTATTAAPPDPLVAVLQARVTLLADYDAARTTLPELAARLQPLAQQTQEQVTVLRRALAVPTATSSAAGSDTSGGAPDGSVGSPGGSAGSSESAPPSAPPPAADPVVVLAALRSGVHAAGAAAGQLCALAPPERAPLLGSLAAAAACHELLLI